MATPTSAAHPHGEMSSRLPRPTHGMAQELTLGQDQQNTDLPAYQFQDAAGLVGGADATKRWERRPKEEGLQSEEAVLGRRV